MSKTVAITGSSRGIGLAFAKLYQAKGWQVYALCRHRSPELEALGVHVIEDIDVGQSGVVSKIREALRNVELDVLINNAGILRNEVLGELDYDTIQQQWETNALGPLRVTEAALESMKSGSKIALITSRMGSIADNTSGGRYGYRMSKAALNIAGVSMAHDLAERGIAVALLHPGLVATDMIGGHGDISADQAAERLMQRIEQLSLDSSGTFWHSNGEVLPW